MYEIMEPMQAHKDLEKPRLAKLAEKALRAFNDENITLDSLKKVADDISTDLLKFSESSVSIAHARESITEMRDYDNLEKAKQKMREIASLINMAEVKVQREEIETKNNGRMIA